jgi:hypothetical protein
LCQIADALIEEQIGPEMSAGDDRWFIASSGSDVPLTDAAQPAPDGSGSTLSPPYNFEPHDLKKLRISRPEDLRRCPRFSRTSDG